MKPLSGGNDNYLKLCSEAIPYIYQNLKKELKASQSVTWLVQSSLTIFDLHSGKEHSIVTYNLTTPDVSSFCYNYHITTWLF